MHSEDGRQALLFKVQRRVGAREAIGGDCLGPANRCKVTPFEAPIAPIRRSRPLGGRVVAAEVDRVVQQLRGIFACSVHCGGLSAIAWIVEAAPVAGAGLARTFVHNHDSADDADDEHHTNYNGDERGVGQSAQSTVRV